MPQGDPKKLLKAHSHMPGDHLKSARNGAIVLGIITFVGLITEAKFHIQIYEYKYSISSSCDQRYEARKII